MAKAIMTIVEKVRIQYEVHYDEDELEFRGITLEQHLKEHKKNPWEAMSEDSIIGDISHDMILDYLDTYLDTVDVDY